MDGQLNLLNNEEGELIIGGYPHEYDIKYDISKFKNTKAETRGAQVYWDLRFQYFLSSKQNFRYCNGQFDITFDFIQANLIYKIILLMNFLNLKKVV